MGGQWRSYREGRGEEVRHYDDDRYDPDIYDDDYNLIDGVGFANEGSALRAESKTNPRVHSCPTCGCRGELTCIDVRKGYQCDECADALERGRDEDRWCWEKEYEPLELANPPQCDNCGLMFWEAKDWLLE